MLRFLITAPLALFAAAAVASAQSSWTVDGDGFGDFKFVQKAIDFAASGDTIVIRAGVYQGAEIDGKALTIVGEGAPTLEPVSAPAPALAIRNLAPDQDVVVRGLVLGGSRFFEQTTVSVEDCESAVLLESLFVYGAGTALEVRDCASVTVTDSNLIAPLTFTDVDPSVGHVGFTPFFGLHAQDSNVFLYACSVSGSTGEESSQVPAGTIPPGTSQAAVSLVGSTLFAVGGSLRGGNGGSDAVHCFPGEDGSPALRIEATAANPTPIARLQGVQLLAGVGGAGGCGLGDGAAPEAVEVNGGLFFELPGEARGFRVLSPTLEGSLGNTVDVEVEAPPGDLMFLYVKRDFAPALFLSSTNIAEHLAFGSSLLGIFQVPGGGSGTLSFPAPIVGQIGGTLHFISQAIFLQPGVGTFDAGPSSVVITDWAL